MIDINYIMGLLDWNNDIAQQSLGIELAKNIECLNAFLQPGVPYGKKVWDNCALIISERSDTILSPYLMDLMRWLQDLNWPGAMCIMERLHKYDFDSSFDFALKESLRTAKMLKDYIWLYNLSMIIKDYDVRYIINLFLGDAYTESNNQIINNYKTSINLPTLAKDTKTNNMYMWQFCADILFSKSDCDLEPHILSLLEWLQDLDFPGCIRIFERLKLFNNKDLLAFAIKNSMESAKALNNSVWIENLTDLNNYLNNNS